MPLEKTVETIENAQEVNEIYAVYQVHFRQNLTLCGEFLLLLSEIILLRPHFGARFPQT